MNYIFGVYIIVDACIYRKIIMIVDVKFNMYIDLSINMNIKM